MKIQELFDIDKFIKINDLKEVTSQSIGYKSYNPQGLFSEEIFGQTEDERKYRCGYIKLPIHVFNPDVAKTIIGRSGGIIRKMAYAEVRCNLVNGVLVAAVDGEYTGLKDLYEIWDQIDIEKTLTTRSRENINILVKSPKRLIFNDKVLVLPPELRKVGELNGKMVKSELNTLYMNILGLKSVLSHTTTNDIYQIYNKFQDAVVNLYTFVNKYVSGKNGFFKKNLMAKNTLWTARNVISAPRYNTDKPQVGLFRTGYPLAALCSLFFPLIRFQMKQFLSYNNILDIHPNPHEVKSNDIANIYDDKMVSDLMMIYMKNPGSRFKILYLDPEETKPIIFTALDLDKNEKIQRPLTLTDVIYICTKIAVVDADRMCYVVRYPIGDYLGAFFTKVHILSTNDTVRLQFRDEVYDTYPKIDPSLPHSVVSTSFASTVNMSNSRLKAIGGDYDGDTIKSTGIWSDEANAEAEKLMYSKVYNIKAECASAFPIEIECLNGLYALTK